MKTPPAPMRQLVTFALLAVTSDALRSVPARGVVRLASTFSPCGRGQPLRAPRSCLLPRMAAGDDAAGEDDGELMAELRKALAKVSDDEQSASDERVLDGFVEDRKGQLNAPLEDLSRDLESVADSIEERLAGELKGVESDLLGRIDAAVEELRRGAKDRPFDRAAAMAADAVADGSALSASLPEGALVVVAGASTPLGAQVVRALGGSGCKWQLRALVTDGSTLPASVGVECESVAMAPFAPTALAKSLSGAAALVVVTAAAGGSGGIEPEVVPKLMKAVGPGMRRLLMVSQHGVERTDKLPFSLQNVFGQLDKQRAAEQEFVLRARKDVPSFAVMRVGKLKDDTGSAPPLSAYESPPKSRAELAAGDRLTGDVNVSGGVSCRRCAGAGGERDLLPRPSRERRRRGVTDAGHWDDQFLKLVGPGLPALP